jgi:hypothetical protein
MAVGATMIPLSADGWWAGRRLMPTVMWQKGFRIAFYAADRDEPPHVHVDRNKKEAKFWLTPFVRMADNKRFNAHDLNVIKRILEENREAILETWNDYFEP